ncbi:MAG: hypothetical protein JXR78_15305 [Victivallales bacterium]|nr:hypothetical protein [Victivallales bacterium]
MNVQDEIRKMEKRLGLLKQVAELDEKRAGLLARLEMDTGAISDVPKGKITRTAPTSLTLRGRTGRKLIQSKRMTAEEIRTAIAPGEYTDVVSLIAAIQNKAGLTKSAIAAAVEITPQDLSHALSGKAYPFALNALRQLGLKTADSDKVKYKTETHARQSLAKGE